MASRPECQVWLLIMPLRGLPLSLSVIIQGHFLGARITRAGHCWLALASPVLEVWNFGKGHLHCASVTPVPLLCSGEGSYLMRQLQTEELPDSFSVLRLPCGPVPEILSSHSRIWHPYTSLLSVQVTSRIPAHLSSFLLGERIGEGPLLS